MLVHSSILRSPKSVERVRGLSRLTSLSDRRKLERHIIPKETLIDNGVFFKVKEVRRINQLPIPCLGRELT
jgi:hypothetical protein